MPRLPKPGGDAGDWGKILNEFLEVEHDDQGKLKTDGSLATKYTKPEDGIPATDLDVSTQSILTDSQTTKSRVETIEQPNWVTRDRLASDVAASVQRSTLSRLGLADPNPGIARLQPLPSLMSDPPTFAAPQKTGVTITSPATIRFNDPRIRIIGSDTLIQAGSIYPDTNYLKRPSLVNTYAVDFIFDGTEIEFAIKGTSESAKYVVMVDGQYAHDGWKGGAADGIANDGSKWYQKITFAARADRRITIWFYGGAYIGDVYIAPTDTLWPSQVPQGPTVIWVGDSFTEGQGAATGTTMYTQVAGQLLGWNVLSSGSGGTGYLQTTGSPFFRVKFRDRIQADCIDRNPDIVCISGGINDSGGFTASQVQAEALLLYQEIKAALPQAALIVSSPFWPNINPNAAVLAIRDGLRTSWEQAGGDIFVDTLNGEVRTASGVIATQGKWITGTGKVGTTVGDGNADFYTTADGTHPSPAGHMYYGQRFASAISSAITALGRA